MENSLFRYSLFLIVLSLFFSISYADEWHITTVDSQGRTGLYTSIALDDNDNPHISYITDYSFKLKYAYWNGNNWNIQVIDSNSEFDGYTCLVLDNQDNPHISYHDSKNGSLKYAHWTGNKWDIEVIDSTSNCGNFCSIDLDSNEYPHISYMGYYGLKYARWTGSEWDIQIVDSPKGASGFTSIGLDSQDNPHISYFYEDDNMKGHLKYAKLTRNSGSQWDIQIVDSSGYVGMWTSIAIDSDDNPHIAYMGNTGVKYAKWTGSKWDISFVSNDDWNGYTSLVLDSNDYPHISYYENWYGDLKYAKRNGSSWDVQVVDLQGFTGYYSSIAINSKDKPCISYYSNEEEALKYAWYGLDNDIDLTSFTAKPNNGAITLNWSISTDEKISGFNLYRREVLSTVSELAPKGMPREIAQSPLQPVEDYVWIKVNSSLITGTNPYSYTDKNVLPETKYEYKLEAVVSDKNETLGKTQVTSGKGTPSSFEITRIYPTPASSVINVDVNITTASDIDIAIYDITGRRVSTVASGLYNEGEYILTSDVSGLTNGVYIVRMTAECFGASKNFVIAK